MSDRSKFIMR